MIHEENPIIKTLNETKTTDHTSKKPEQANADYWRLFYDIQAPLVDAGCIDVNSKAHTIAKRLYKKWIEKKDK